MLFQTPDLLEAELKVLSEINDLREKLRFQLHEPRRWVGSLRRLSLARAIQGSNTIEGYTAELDDAVAVAAGEEPVDTDTETELALKGYRDAMTYVLQLSYDPGFQYSEQLIKSLHFIMIGHDLSKSPGLYRPGAVFVYGSDSGEVVYEGAPVDSVPTLVSELVDELNTKSDAPAMIRGAMSHLNLVMIHPFRDGNGRMARALQSLVLAREGFLSPVFVSIEEYLGRNTQAYYDILAEVGQGSWNPQNDARPWLRFSLTAHLRQARTMLRRVRESERLWTELEKIADQEGLADRVVAVMFDAAIGLRVRNNTYRAAIADLEEISDATASRDLGKLVDADLLESHGEKRGRCYTRSPRLAAVWQAIVESRDPKDDRDPFADAA
ncbi:MAG TPA: Fic family protein [Acidimicrobiia bacterium]|nr:Fic family protein [Acidimicrobiia bacterium]